MVKRHLVRRATSLSAAAVVIGGTLVGTQLTAGVANAGANAGTLRHLTYRGASTTWPTPKKVSGSGAVNLREDGKIQRFINRSNSPRPSASSLQSKSGVRPYSATWVPIVNAATVHSTAPNKTGGFEGLTEYDNQATNGFSVEPPDQGMCVGGGFVLEAVNVAAQVYRTDGSPAAPAVSLNQIYNYPVSGSGAPFLTDPSCLFDNTTHRFFLDVLTLDIDPKTGNLTGTNHLDIAVSKTSDPRRGWYLYSIPVTDTGGANGPAHTDCPCLGDFPHSGVDRYGYFLTTNEYPFSGKGQYGNGFNGAQVYAIDKARLANGASSLPYVHFDHNQTADGNPAFTLWPTQSPGTNQYATGNNGTEYFLASRASEEARPNDFTGHASDIALWAVVNTGSLRGSSPSPQLRSHVVNSEQYGVPPVANQKSGPVPLRDCLTVDCANLGTDPYAPEDEGPLDSSDSRMLTAWYAGGRVLGALDTAMQVAGNIQSGAAWFSVDDNNGFPVIRQQGFLGVAHNNVIYPSVATDATGHGAVALTLVGNGHFPSAAYTRWAPATGTGTDVYTSSEGKAPEDGFCEYLAFNCGGGSSTPLIRPRWGDYGAAAFDGTHVWLASEYIGHSCDFSTFRQEYTCGHTRTFYGNWSTYITKLMMASS